MNTLSKKVLGTIDKFNMIKSGQTVIAAVSGGFDSVCMLNILKELMPLRKFELCVAHVNHSFRSEADHDQKLVEDMAEKLGLKCYTLKADVSGYAENNKISFETAGREIRYNYFSEISKKYDSPIIATAHNANDSIESFMMHLMRGSGLTGLTGIKPVRGNIIRPLIEISRDEIESYCKENELIIAEDITNLSDDYARNDIRHNVVAEMLKRCSTDSLTRTMQILSDDDKFLQEYVDLISNKYITYFENRVKIEIKKFNTLPVALRRRLIRMAIPKTIMQIGLVHIDDCVKLAEKNHGLKRLLLPGKIKAEVNKGILIIEEVQTNE